MWKNKCFWTQLFLVIYRGISIFLLMWQTVNLETRVRGGLIRPSSFPFSLDWPNARRKRKKRRGRTRRERKQNRGPLPLPSNTGYTILSSPLPPPSLRLMSGIYFLPLHSLGAIVCVYREEAFFVFQFIFPLFQGNGAFFRLMALFRGESFQFGLIMKEGIRETCHSFHGRGEK